jgi:UDP-N-acetylmuramoylalanine--D-glutamate ligase
LVVAPGVPLTHPAPHWVVCKAKAAGVEVIGDIELFFRERGRVAPRSPVIAITGTNGKSTTTALTAHVLRELGFDVQMGGNIGVGVLSLAPPAAGRIHVLELSSYQIDTTPTLVPTVGVLLNITPDHLDRHGTLETYAAVKARLPHKAERAVVCLDDALTRGIASSIAPAVRLCAFASEVSDGSSLPMFRTDGARLLDVDGQAIVSLAGIGALRGAHNAQNALACLTALSALAKALPGLGVWQPARLQAAFASFPGLAHRMEQLGHVGKVLIVNDSKATNADSTEKALAAFDRDIYWIAGGTPKEGGILPLAGFFPRVAKAYLIGQSADAFAETLAGHSPTEICGTLDVAIASAVRDAEGSAAPMPVVLLSPACASFDQYRSFEHRGDHFRTLAFALPGFAKIASA